MDIHKSGIKFRLLENFLIWFLILKFISINWVSCDLAIISLSNNQIWKENLERDFKFLTGYRIRCLNYQSCLICALRKCWFCKSSNESKVLLFSWNFQLPSWYKSLIVIWPVEDCYFGPHRGLMGNHTTSPVFILCINICQ